jgi:hypothetical protein
VTIQNDTPVKIVWTQVCAYVRRNLPSYRMRPGEYRRIEQQSAQIFSGYMFRGHDIKSAGEATQAEMLLMFMRGIRVNESAKTGKQSNLHADVPED